MNTTIQIRVDKNTKKEADKTFKKMGLDTSSGIKLFLHRVIQSRSIPFQIRTENGFTIEQERKMLKEAEHALKYGKSYKTAREMFDDIMKN